MTLREFTYGVDNATAVIIREDKQNVDTMTLKTDFDVTTVIGDEIKFYDENNALAFAGFIERREVTGVQTLYCEDYGSILKRSITNKIFVDYLAEDIMAEVVTNAGLTYVSTITTTEIIPTYSADKKNSQEIVEELADKLLANYTTDVNKNWKLELEAGTNSSKTIDNSRATIDGTWEEDITELVNDVYVEGDNRSVFNKEESFNGTGSLDTFTLTEIPIDIRVEHPVGTLLTGYVKGQSTGDYQILRDQKKVIFDISPGSGTDNVFISYNYSIPVSIRRRNKASIDSLGGDPEGVRSSIVRKNWVVTREDARGYANYIIQNFSNPLVSSTWIINNQTDINDWQNYLPNQAIFVNDDLRGYSDFYNIRKVERKYGTGPALKITLGSPETNLALWDKQVADRIRQLEQSDNNSTILNEDEYIEENVTQQFDVDVFDIEKKTFASDTFYLEENSSGTRNQMLESGLGPVMREVGYTSSSVLVTNSIRVTEDDMTERLTEGGEIRLTEAGNLDINNQGAVTITYMNLARTNFINNLESNITHIAVGDDDTTPTESDTTLGNETFIDALFDVIVSTSTTLSMTMFMDTVDNNGNDIKETGVFDASSGGNLYNHSLTNIISKDSTIEVFIETQFKFSVENTNI